LILVFIRSQKCSRWKELTTALLFHAEVAHRGCIATEFRFLNAGAPFEIGFDLQQPSTNYESFVSILNDGGPNGGTPLCRHINEVAQKIRMLAPSLLSSGKKAVVVIATDGEASDGDIRDALRPLKDLPVVIVLRFCTDDDKIIDYWNKTDSELELNMDVIDDFFGESKEIHEVNPWLTYGEQLHRLREFGVTLKEIDNVDEKKLSNEEMVKICKLIVGPVVDSFPPPQMDMSGFVRELEKSLSLIPKVCSSITEKKESWINVHELKRHYKGGKSGGGGKCIIS
jgi:hypothetical protein